MNFVDVQPQSFLDYAWTSPTQVGASAPKSARTSRKQNRCCDQWYVMFSGIGFQVEVLFNAFGRNLVLSSFRVFTVLCNMWIR